MPCCRFLCQYETAKLVRIQSVRLGSLKWGLNGFILLLICIMMLWNRKYQEFDLVVSSVTTKVKGVAQTQLPGIGDVVWDVVDYSGPSQDKNSFFVVTNVIVTKNQKQGKCPEAPLKDRTCRSDKDCEKGSWDQLSHGVQTGSCVRFDVLKKTCEVSAWCPVETKTKPPRPALLAAAENFTVLIKNNIRFPAFNFIRRNILPNMNDAYLRTCTRTDDSLCPIFRLGDIVRDAGEKFSEMAVEGGVIGILIKWDCNLDHLMKRCLPRYSFRRLDEKESNRTLYPGLNFRFAKYNTVNGVEERTLYKAFGIRFDVMVFGQAGKFSFIQLIIYIGSTLSYYALTTILIDWLIGTSCYSAEQNYSEKKVESVQDKQKCILCVSYVDENNIRLVKRSQKKSLQDIRPWSVEPRKEDVGHLQAVLSLLQMDPESLPLLENKPEVNPRPRRPSWCRCDCCSPSSLPHEELCCRRSAGACIASSPLFEQLVLRRPLLEAVLLYRDPLTPPSDQAQTAALRHCAYRQYISWRFGVPPADTHPAIPSCCVWRIRDEYPSPDGQYGGFRPTRTATMQACANGEL
ncbi:P2X purinoceptor 7 [Cheilinus undulatus]|uniref:P2X purinoceptor 7 n=1 Tax=Cheilinus undulatus TaxID=241271 RepID=UPI001BD1D686|nr:P2X purinoceptor 7 [Cheilinus undulatus]XP_041644412.1 P2X purinoceptor 7 [Cheilinus undulatus]